MFTLKTAARATLLGLCLAAMLTSCARKTPAEKLEEGKKLWEERALARAVLKFKQITRETPTDPAAIEARFMLARYYFQQGDVKEGMAELDIVRQTKKLDEPQGFGAFVSQVSISRQAGDVEGALKYIDEAIKTEKLDEELSTTIQLMRADILMADKSQARQDEGVSIIRRVAMGGTDARARGEAREGLARYYRSKGQFDQSNEVYAQYMEKFPDDKINPQLEMAQAINLKAAKKDDEAAKMFAAGVEKFNKQVESELDKEKRGHLLLTLAQNYEVFGDLEKARDIMERVMGENPRTPLAIQTEFGIGEMYAKAGRFDDAVALYEQIKRENPKSKIEEMAGTAISRIQDMKKKVAEGATSGTLEKAPAPPAVPGKREK